jgi:formate/nitrite transporter FocA (FNT family)
MYFIPYALIIKQFDSAFATATKLDLSHLTWQTFFINNLLPVTIGNIIGGGIMVAGIYWLIYLRERT